MSNLIELARDVDRKMEGGRPSTSSYQRVNRIVPEEMIIDENSLIRSRQLPDDKSLVNINNSYSSSSSIDSSSSPVAIDCSLESKLTHQYEQERLKTPTQGSHILRYIRRLFCGRFPAFKRRMMDLKGNTDPKEFVTNGVSNTKYNILTFIPLVLYEQFKYFFNMFYLGVALAQFLPFLKVGPLFTYLAPLSFVLAVTISKEAYDDYKRWVRDREANRQIYVRLTVDGLIETAASDIQVGHIIEMHAKQRVPADMVFLRTSNENGSTFVRTDQLDGETDWKLRRAVQCTQRLMRNEDLFHMDAVLHAEAPRKDIYDFLGKFTCYESIDSHMNTRINTTTTVGRENIGNLIEEGLTLENTLWANTVVTSGTVIGMAVYTGKETRSNMNTMGAKTKTGLFDLEVNFLSKVLFCLLVVLALVLCAFKGFGSIWWVYLLRFMLLLSSIIPISLRVNLDMAKTVCSVRIMRDKNMPNTLVRTSTIPEELGRIDYLLTDKTGTLTKNDMVFKKLSIGRATFVKEDIEQIRSFVAENKKSEITATLRDSILGLALCHNVTPVYEDDGELVFQAASPDEVALVKFARDAGIKLIDRTETQITLEVLSRSVCYDVLYCFPFNSENKRMGIIVKSHDDEIHFYLKGAENVLMPLLQPKGASWLEEECENFARQGLRTLVLCHKQLSVEELSKFDSRYSLAMKAMTDRHKRMQNEITILESDMKLLALTGVDDKLQAHVPSTLESLRHAGIKIWMLTGDKTETAICISISAGLKPRTHSLCLVTSTTTPTEASIREVLREFSLGPRDTVLVLDGQSLAVCLLRFPQFFIETASLAPTVICCRCSPTQKADIVNAIKKYTGRRTCSIGDGGNDVSMIQAADVGVGIVGKEGRQASSAADFSLPQFFLIRRLLLWHGRNAYQRSARLAQFVIHRGLIIAIIQVIFSSIFFFVPIAIFQGWLQVGYATYYTTAPVFSMVLDQELPPEIVFMFPELYQSLRNGRVMSIKTFFAWVWMSIYQGAVIMMGAILLFENTFTSIISITFTSLILSELLNVASEIHKWHSLMVVSQICTVIIYIFSMFILRSYFDITFIMTASFWGKVSLITIASWLPVHIFKVLDQLLRPPQYAKLIAV